MKSYQSQNSMPNVGADVVVRGHHVGVVVDGFRFCKLASGLMRSKMEAILKSYLTRWL